MHCRPITTDAVVGRRKRSALRLKSVSNMLLAGRHFGFRGKSYSKEGLDDFYGSCKYFLLFGKLIGLVPLGSGLGGDNKVLKGSMASTFLGGIIVVLLFANALVGLFKLGKSNFLNAAEYSRAPITFAYYTTASFIYVYFHRYSTEFFRLFSQWNRLEVQFSEADRSLMRDVNLVAFTTMTSAILENAVSHMRLSFAFGPTEAVTKRFSENDTFLNIYYSMNHRTWEELIPYHPAMGLYAIVGDKLAWYSWNFMDIIIVVFSRALGFKFRALYRQSEETFNHRRLLHDTSRWSQMTKDHSTLYNYFFDITEFLSPLIFVSFAINVYCICLQIHFGLSVSSKKTAMDHIYAIWSIMHLLARVFLIIRSGAHLNEWAHRLVELLRKCPTDAYNLDVLRTERFINRNIIALTGLGCFRVTKSLLLDIISVIFTFEIVMLQATTTNSLDQDSATGTSCPPITQCTVPSG